jgi:hypothetical protein
MSLKIHSLMPNYLPTTQHKPIIRPQIADKTKQTNQAIKHLAIRFGGEDEVKPPKKTIGDFYQKVLKEQPLKPKDANKMFEIEFSVGKSPKKASVEDYRKAFDTKLLAIAGYKMFDEREIGLARNLMKTEDSWTLKSIGSRDAEDGRQDGNLKVKTSKFSLEHTKIVGQAVLQFCEYEAKLADVNQSHAENETNQMMLDHGKVLWNSLVNTVEGTINTGIDAAISNGGQKPLILLNPNRPRVDLSGIKADYKSEMMRTDVNGVVDGNGIKRGDFTEGAVTILGPLVVGKVTTPTRLNELNLQFPLRNGTAAKIGVVNMQSELDPFIARQVGKTISENPVASRAYSQMQKFGTEVKLDFGKPPNSNTQGLFFRFKNRFNVYMQNNGTAKNAVSTICHESCHGRSLQKGRMLGSQFDEFRAFTREELFMNNGKRPSLNRRRSIWDQIQITYKDKSIEKNPFTGVREK